VLDDLIALVGVVVLALIVLSGIIFFLLPLFAFLAELVALPLLALFFRGARVVEARNEATGERVRVRVRGRDEARRVERGSPRSCRRRPSSRTPFAYFLSSAACA
jgi:hypothetical protein